MRRYETISIIHPGVGEDVLNSISQKTAEIIEKEAGTIITVDNWGLKKLAYPINKEQQGYYIYTEYAAVPSAVAEMERIFKIDDNVLKFMTIKLQEVYDPNKAVKSSLTARAHDDADEAESDEDE
ncbi:MAG: 30S ribosomal protein S6 [Desulfobulbaceae bacterium DB1]|nr:MAG: 30S ribosomal protein S6 [Desulfobulbaceae bacterium DB1]